MGSTAAIERLRKVKELLQVERNEDYRLYNELFLRVSLEQRKKNGVTWYPVKINNEELGSGELMHLEIERTTMIDVPHQFSSGKNITLFSAHGENDHQLTATIKSASRNSLKIVLNTD